MLRMTVSDIARATGAAVLLEGARDVAGEVVVDSREAREGGLFVAFSGERADGNAYLASAARAGSAAVVATAEPPAEALEAARAAGCAVLRAEGDDGEEFLLRLAGAWRDLHPGWLVLAVTGSVGKTTTKEMVAAGAAAQRRTHATRGNLNSLIGLPLTVLAAPEDAEVVVLELGMNHPHEIDRATSASSAAARTSPAPRPRSSPACAPTTASAPRSPLRARETSRPSSPTASPVPRGSTS